MGNILHFIYYDFLLFDNNLFNLIGRELFNCFSRSLFNCFALAFLNTRINFILVKIICLSIFLTLILFMLFNYTGTNNVNVCNILKMCSALLCICCTYFWFIMTTINIIFHVSFFDTHFLISEFYISTISFILLMDVSFY